jgi:hypothetical protein
VDHPPWTRVPNGGDIDQIFGVLVCLPTAPVLPTLQGAEVSVRLRFMGSSRTSLMNLSMPTQMGTRHATHNRGSKRKQPPLEAI